MLKNGSAAGADANAHARLAVGAQLVALFGFRGSVQLENTGRFGFEGVGRIASGLAAGHQHIGLLLGKLTQGLRLGQERGTSVGLTTAGDATLHRCQHRRRHGHAGQRRPQGQACDGERACVQDEGMKVMRFVRMVVLVPFIAAVTSGAAWAEVWSRAYKVSLPLPETQTRAALRIEAMQKARDLASAEFGTVVLKQVTVANDSLSERVRTVSAGLTKVRVASESLRQSSDGVVLVDYRLDVEVDGSELDRQVKILATNAERDQALKNTRRENEVLKAQNQVLQEHGGSDGKGRAMAAAIEMAAGGGNAGVRAPVRIEMPPGALLAAANRDPEGEALVGRFEALVMKPLLSAPLSFRVISADLKGDGVAVRFSGFIDGWHGVMRNATKSFLVPQKVGASGLERCAVSLSGSALLDSALRSEALVLDLKLGGQRQYWILGEYKGSGAGFCVHGEVQSVMTLPMAQAKDVERIEARVARASELPTGWREQARRDLLLRPY